MTLIVSKVRNDKEFFENEDIENITKGLSILKKYDGDVNLMSEGATLFTAWEFRIASHLHETKVTGLTARRCFAYSGLSEHFFNR